jgi:hypothetical protein
MSIPRKSKSKVRIPVTKGKLEDYSLSDTMEHRRKILRKLAKRDTWEEIVKRLNVLYIYNKNRYPENAMKFKRDMKYIQRLYEKERSSPLYKSMSKRKSRISKRKSKSKRKSSYKSRR